MLSSEDSAVFDKWGDAARAGFQAIPDMLFKHQDELGLTPTELVVLLNILMHWWYREKKPFPRPTTIAKRMGVDIRTVQRAIQKLETEGLLIRQKNEDKITKLDPSPLVQKLTDFAHRDADFIARTGGLVSQ